jgi:hypothetical protein
MTDKTRSPGAWAHDRRQDDWAITPKIQQAASAPPKIRMTKPVRSDRCICRRSGLTIQID